MRFLITKRAIAGLAAVLVLPVLAGVNQSYAQQVPTSRPVMQQSFSPVVKMAAPSVVNVYGTRQEQRGQNPFQDDPFFRRFFGDRGFGVPQERVQQSLGSGVIVDASGLVMTNHHVIEGMSEVKVSLSDKREFEAEIILRDPRTDLAVLRLKGAPSLPALPLGDADALEVGDIVLAVGNPFGVGQTVTQGIVSALARTQVGVGDFQSFIQTDAAINPGNSGGALVDMAGKLVGINTAIFSKSGGSHGIGFAIPSSMVRVVMDSAKAGSKLVRRPWFGARVQAVSADMVDGLGLERPAGVLVARLDEKGPASDAGLKRSDVILSVDGVNVDDPEAFGYRFATRTLGGTASLGVSRAGRRIIVPVKLVGAPESRPREAFTVKGRTPMTGITVWNLSPAAAEELAIDLSNDGVVVAEVAAGSTAAQIGFKKGDILLAISNEKIENTKSLDKLTTERKRVWEITISREGQVFTQAFGG
jgi:Do/DeqQ family serine protease